LKDLPTSLVLASNGRLLWVGQISGRLLISNNLQSASSAIKTVHLTAYRACFHLWAICPLGHRSSKCLIISSINHEFKVWMVIIASITHLHLPFIDDPLNNDANQWNICGQLIFILTIFLSPWSLDACSGESLSEGAEPWKWVVFCAPVPLVYLMCDCQNDLGIQPWRSIHQQTRNFMTSFYRLVQNCTELYKKGNCCTIVYKCPQVPTNITSLLM